MMVVRGKVEGGKGKHGHALESLNISRDAGFNIHTLGPDMPVTFMCIRKQEKKGGREKDEKGSDKSSI